MIKRNWSLTEQSRSIQMFTLKSLMSWLQSHTLLAWPDCLRISFHLSIERIFHAEFADGNNHSRTLHGDQQFSLPSLMINISCPDMSLIFSISKCAKENVSLLRFGEEDKVNRRDQWNDVFHSWKYWSNIYSRALLSVWCIDLVFRCVLGMAPAGHRSKWKRTRCSGYLRTEKVSCSFVGGSHRHRSLQMRGTRSQESTSLHHLSFLLC